MKLELTGNYIPFTDEQHAQMRALYEQGETAEAIAHKFGICDSAVRRRLRMMGCTLRRRGVRHLISDEQCVELVREKEALGTLNRAFAKRLNIGIRTADEALTRGRKILAAQAS